MESYDNYSGHRKMSVVEGFPLFGESVIGGSTVYKKVYTQPVRTLVYLRMYMLKTYYVYDSC